MAETDTLSDKRQKARTPIGYAVQLFLKDKDDKSLIEDMVVFVRDISFTGVGLIVPNIILGKHHLFYEPREKGAQLLLKFRSEEGQKIFLELHPKWYRRGDEDESSYFYLGVEFSQESIKDDVLELIHVSRDTVTPKKSWFASVFSL